MLKEVRDVLKELAGHELRKDLGLLLHPEELVACQEVGQSLFWASFLQEPEEAPAVKPTRFEQLYELSASHAPETRAVSNLLGPKAAGVLRLLMAGSRISRDFNSLSWI